MPWYVELAFMLVFGYVGVMVPMVVLLILLIVGLLINDEIQVWRIMNGDHSRGSCDDRDPTDQDTD